MEPSLVPNMYQGKEPFKVLVRTSCLKSVQGDYYVVGARKIAFCECTFELLSVGMEGGGDNRRE